jgi:glycerol-3-phosphate acyltransferase PlsY
VDALAAALIGYLIGSIPASYLIGRLVRGIDVREVGEGNVGARNVFHEVGSAWGVAAFAADLGKGLAVGLLFRHRPSWQLIVAGTYMIAGHAYPIWLRFVGGKGLASAGGFAVALLPWAALIGVAAAAIVWFATWRFLPTVVAAIVVTFLGAPVVGYSWAAMGIALGMFLLVGAKRYVDEPRMREVEARTGWDRTRGGSRR